MNRRTAVMTLAGLYASVIVSMTILGGRSAVAATPPKPDDQ